MKVFIKIILLFIFSFNVIFGQEFGASVDKSSVGQNERFQVYFTFQNGDINRLSEFTPPSFKGLKVLSGPNESRSMQIINGQVSGSLTYSFIIVGQEIGDFTIESASVSYGGTKLTSDPLKLSVIKGTSTNKQVDKKLGISQEELEKSVFIRAIPNKTRIMQGEQLTVTYKLYTNTNISSPQISKLPTFSGFWSEELETPQNIQFNIEMYNGERFRAATIKKVALFPTKSGSLELTPFELKVPVIVKSRRSRNDIFDDFFNDSFFGRTETIDHLAKSNKVSIKVDPLPSGNVPSSFTGAVGKFDFDVQLDKNDVDLNEAITVKTRISGTGNISLLKLPEIQFPSGFEKYEPKTNENISRRNTVSGRKDIEFIIVPRIPGVKEIPPLQFSYYDLNKNNYVTLTSQPFTINVKEGEGGFAQNTSGYTKEDIKLLNEDIRFINTSSFDFIKRENIANVSVLFILGLIFPLSGLLALIIFRKRQDKLAGNLSLLRFQNAEKSAKKSLKLASKSLETNDLVKYYNYLSQALFGFLGDKLGIQNADFTLDRAIEKLEQKNVDENLVSRIKKVSEKCEFARFAPNAVGSDSSGEIYKSVENIINEIASSVQLKK
ncbi:MAG: protein BatD [Ignavibacteriae bacterium]|nr:protein BatD [Ignavibacteriota bacterium]